MLARQLGGSGTRVSVQDSSRRFSVLLGQLCWVRHTDLCVSKFDTPALPSSRLDVHAEKVRGARIILLKATHWPYILAIYTYEKATARLEDTVADWRYQSQSKLTSHRRLQVGGRVQRRSLRWPALGNRSEASLPAKTTTSERHIAVATNGELVVEMQEIKKTVEKLMMHEMMEQRLDKQQTLIKKLNTQINELNQRLVRRRLDGEQ